VIICNLKKKEEAVMKKLLAFLLLFKFSVAVADAGSIKTTINFTIHGQKKQANPNWLSAGVQLYQLKNGMAVKVDAKRPDAQDNCSFDWM
jgi:hypothetical protein